MRRAVLGVAVAIGVLLGGAGPARADDLQYVWRRSCAVCLVERPAVALGSARAVDLDTLPLAEAARLRVLVTPTRIRVLSGGAVGRRLGPRPYPRDRATSDLLAAGAGARLEAQGDAATDPARAARLYAGALAAGQGGDLDLHARLLEAELGRGAPGICLGRADEALMARPLDEAGIVPVAQVALACILALPPSAAGRRLAAQLATRLERHGASLERTSLARFEAFRLARELHRERGDTPAARRAADEAAEALIARGYVDVRGEAWIVGRLARAEAALLAGDLDQARSLAAEASEKLVDSHLGDVLLARVHALAGDRPAAEKALAGARRKAPGLAAVEVLAAEAEILEQFRDHAAACRARKAQRKALERLPVGLRPTALPRVTQAEQVACGWPR